MLCQKFILLPPFQNYATNAKPFRSTIHAAEAGRMSTPTSMCNVAKDQPCVGGVMWGIAMSSHAVPGDRPTVEDANWTAVNEFLFGPNLPILPLAFN